MPIYEFYCRKCNTIYNFFSKSVNTSLVPSCPTCKNVTLVRQMSVFAAITGSGKNDATDDSLQGFDERKMEKAMMQFAAQAEKMKDDDPQAAAKLMRKLSETTGMKLGDGFQEALQRLEAGEDPDKIDEEMGDILSGEDPFGKKQGGKMPVSRKPRKDETLYDL
ncbi:MAG: zinc ribbon domain-containing protein [Smithellaceae bacterium]|nr:zinc ribbon domain-containing protein [Smithellaceae bacterium]